MEFKKIITDWNKLPVFLDMETTCALLRCCDVTVAKHIKNGDFKGNRLGRSWLIDRDSVRTFVVGGNQ